EGPVDVDADLAGDAQVGQGSEVGRSLLHGEDAHPATGEPADDPADGQDPEQCSGGSPDTAVPAAASECPAIGEHGPVSDEIEDQVVARAGAGDVLTAVVDHGVRAERPHEVELAGVVDPRDVRTEPLGELEG